MNILDFITQTLVAEFIVVVAGVLFAHFIQGWWEKRRFGNWKVILMRDGNPVLQRAISPRKARELSEEPAELSVFLKGIASPYAWITCDLIEEGKKIGLLAEDRSLRQYVIDLDKNPPAPGGERREGIGG